MSKITKICNKCEKKFEVYSYLKNRKFCSKKCYYEWLKKHPSTGSFQQGHEVPQEWRDKSSKAHKGKKLTDEHKEKLRGKRPNQKYKRTKQHQAKLNEANRKKWQDPEYKQKMINIHKGQKPSVKTKKKMSENNARYWLDKKFSKEMIEKMRIGHIGKTASIETRLKQRESSLGSKNHQWIDGRTPQFRKIRHSLPTQLWREASFERDDYTCQKCDKRGIFLEVHHILNFAEYPDLRFVVSNGITLCKECHIKFHNKYGRKNNSIFQIKEFLPIEELLQKNVSY